MVAMDDTTAESADGGVTPEGDDANDDEEEEGRLWPGEVGVRDAVDEGEDAREWGDEEEELYAELRESGEGATSVVVGRFLDGRMGSKLSLHSGLRRRDMITACTLGSGSGVLHSTMAWRWIQAMAVS
jgi:hypothetical protein